MALINTGGLTLAEYEKKRSASFLKYRFSSRGIESLNKFLSKGVPAGYSALTWMEKIYNDEYDKAHAKALVPAKPIGKKTTKPIKSNSKKVENNKKEAVKAGLFGSSASQANTNVILSGKSSPEVTIASLERAATDLEAGIAGATMADHLNLALTYEQFGKIQAHVSADGHISLKEIEDTIRKFNPSLSDALVAHCSALIAKEMHIASDKLYPVEVRDASPQAKAQIPSSMRKINFAKFAVVPLVGVLLWYFFFKKK